MDGLDAVSPSSQLVLAQIGTRDQVDANGKVTREGQVVVMEPKLLPEFIDILQDRSRLKLLQNAVHDFRFLMAKYGIHMSGMYCTMLAEKRFLML
jgi:ribonuclease D